MVWLAFPSDSWAVVTTAAVCQDKESFIILFVALPDVTIHEVTSDHEFVVLACDGIWDVLSSQEVVDFVRVRISQQMEPEIVSESLCYVCLLLDLVTVLCAAKFTGKCSINRFMIVCILCGL